MIEDPRVLGVFVYRLLLVAIGFAVASELSRIADALDRAYPAPRKVTASER